MKDKIKIHLPKSIFYGYAISSMLIITMMTISSLIYAFSDKMFQAYFRNLVNVSEEVAALQFRQLIIIRYVINVVIFVFMTLYTYFAYVKVKVGWTFALVWLLLFVGNIIGCWVIKYGGNIWFNVAITTFSTIGVVVSFYMYILINQLKGFKQMKKRFGS